MANRTESEGSEPTELSSPARRGRPRRGEGPGLTREAAVAAVIRIAEEQGDAGLSMRNLAAELGVSAKILYRHVRNKEELITLAGEVMLDRWDFPDPSLPWRERLEGIMLEGAFRAQRYRSVAQYMLLRRLDSEEPASVRKFSDAAMACLAEAGCTPEDARRLLDVYVLLVLGVIASEGDKVGSAIPTIRIEEAVRTGLTCIVAGIKALSGRK